MTGDLDEMTWPDLTARYASLLASLETATAELNERFQACAVRPYCPRCCSCGFTCRGLAAMDRHLDQYPGTDARNELMTGQAR